MGPLATAWLRWVTRTRGRVAAAPVDAAVPVPKSKVPAEYRPLFKYLDQRFADGVVLTFAQIEDLLGTGLPDVARHEARWWADSDGEGGQTPQSRSWCQAGRTALANLHAEVVRFDRVLA